MKATIEAKHKMKEHRDPVTGDMLTTGEWISWKIQEIIRNWAFLGILTVVTIICWVTNNPIVLTWWNLNASFYAVILETIVGIAFLNQTRRDAVIIWHIDKKDQRIIEIAEQIIEIAQHLDKQDALILRIVKHLQVEIEEVI